MKNSISKRLQICSENTGEQISAPLGNIESLDGIIAELKEENSSLIEKRDLLKLQIVECESILNTRSII